MGKVCSTIREDLVSVWLHVRKVIAHVRKHAAEREVSIVILKDIHNDRNIYKVSEDGKDSISQVDSDVIFVLWVIFNCHLNFNVKGGMTYIYFLFYIKIVTKT